VIETKSHDSSIRQKHAHLSCKKKKLQTRVNAKENEKTETSILGPIGQKKITAEMKKVPDQPGEEQLSPGK